MIQTKSYRSEDSEVVRTSIWLTKKMKTEIEMTLNDPNASSHCINTSEFIRFSIQKELDRLKNERNRRY